MARVRWEDLREARRLQELFHGRFSEDDAVRLYQHCNRDLQDAINLVFRGEPREIRNLLGEGERRIVAARSGRNINDVLRNHIPDEVRQFGCKQCDRMWWRNVPSRKTLSKCSVCKLRFKAIPKEKEWGWAEHWCHSCCRTFGQLEIKAMDDANDNQNHTPADVTTKQRIRSYHEEYREL